MRWRTSSRPARPACACDACVGRRRERVFVGPDGGTKGGKD
jgi:hypothetical protein